VTVPAISQHIANIFEEGELAPEATVKSYLAVRTEGNRSVSRPVEHYSLPVVLAVGYRVRSPRGTQFRKWATTRLEEYVVKGFTMDDDRLKRPAGADYFDELLARIREIRASEARVYQRIREIFALASDYAEGEQETLRFFAFMQNKMHYAATGLTAAEIVRRRADAEKPNMGLTSWSGGRVLKRDIGTAKNYLDEGEIDTLNRITVMFLDRPSSAHSVARTSRWRTGPRCSTSSSPTTSCPCSPAPAACRTRTRSTGRRRSTPRSPIGAASRQRRRAPSATSTISPRPQSCSKANATRPPHRRARLDARRRKRELRCNGARSLRGVSRAFIGTLTAALDLRDVDLNGGTDAEP
jgi:hypothetical protein